MGGTLVKGSRGTRTRSAIGGSGAKRKGYLQTKVLENTLSNIVILAKTEIGNSGTKYLQAFNKTTKSPWKLLFVKWILNQNNIQVLDKFSTIKSIVENLRPGSAIAGNLWISSDYSNIGICINSSQHISGDVNGIVAYQSNKGGYCYNLAQHIISMNSTEGLTPLKDCLKTQQNLTDKNLAIKKVLSDWIYVVRIGDYLYKNTEDITKTISTLQKKLDIYYIKISQIESEEVRLNYTEKYIKPLEESIISLSNNSSFNIKYNQLMGDAYNFYYKFYNTYINSKTKSVTPEAIIQEYQKIQETINLYIEEESYSLLEEKFVKAGAAMSLNNFLNNIEDYIFALEVYLEKASKNLAAIDNTSIFQLEEQAINNKYQINSLKQQKIDAENRLTDSYNDYDNYILALDDTFNPEEQYFVKIDNRYEAISLYQPNKYYFVDSIDGDIKISDSYEENIQYYYDKNVKEPIYINGEYIPGYYYIKIDIEDILKQININTNNAQQNQALLKRNHYNYYIIVNEYNKYDNLLKNFDDNKNKFFENNFSDKYTYWNKEVIESPQSLLFWLEFLSNDSELSSYSIQNIGDRAKVENNANATSIYFRDIPQIIYYNGTKPDKVKTGYTYVNISDSAKALFSISAQKQSAKDIIDTNLYNYSYCAEELSLTTIPIFYLEPNTRIYINDVKDNIEGEYLINKISIPISYNGTMQITGTRAPERIY